MENSHGLNIEQLIPLLRAERKAGRAVALTVRSNSMLPLLRQGDQIEIVQVHPSELRQGDIVTIVETAALTGSQQADLLTHRLWQATPDQLHTRGDRLLQFDTAVSSDQLLGKVIARRRQRTLRLDQGVGQRLHAHLAATAAWESGQLAANRSNQSALLFRIRHRLLQLWGSLLAQIVNVLIFIGMLVA